MRLNFLPAHMLKDMLKKKEISSKDIADECAKATERLQDTLNAYIHFDRQEMMEQASYADAFIAENRSGKAFDFTGIPIAVKDNICTRDIKTTCASKILQNYVPVYDATVIKKLKGQKYVLSGKLNMDEFAMGSSNENSAFGLVRNPWDIERVPGGSSGGPAAAVAAGLAPCSLGSDTGGSIRQPASLCGVVGLKPTYGLVSRYGLVAFASSLDQIGPITRDVTDSAFLLSAICGWDEYDSTSINTESPASSGNFFAENNGGSDLSIFKRGRAGYSSFLVKDIKGLKIGVPDELMAAGTDSEIKDSVNFVLSLAESMGAEIETVSLPSFEYALSVYYIIAPSEASSNLSRFDGVRYGYRNKNALSLRSMYRKTRAEGFGPEVKRRIMIGTYCLSSGYYDAYYEKAQRVRTLIINDFKKAFSKYDVLISPTSPTTAFKIGEKAEDPLRMYMSDICTIPVNLAGLPAISIPSGLSGNNLPIGVQIIANTLREDLIFRTAYSLEKAIGFNKLPVHLYEK